MIWSLPARSWICWSIYVRYLYTILRSAAGARRERDGSETGAKCVRNWARRKRDGSESEARWNNTKRDKTRRNETKRDRTRPNETKPDKTRRRDESKMEWDMQFKLDATSNVNYYLVVGRTRQLHRYSLSGTVGTYRSCCHLLGTTYTMDQGDEF